MLMAEIYYFLGSEQYQPEELVTLAQKAEQVGFDGVLLSDHFHPWVDDVSAAGFSFSTLGAIATVTERIKLMSGVVTPLFRYHPAVVAQASATLDRLSNGRFELGVGTGENLNEGPLGFQFPQYAERADRMREALELMHRLLAGETVGFQGRYYQLKQAKLYSPPLEGVDVWLAAGGPKSAQLAGQMSSGVITSVKDISETMEQIVQPAKLERSDIRLMATRWSVFAQNKKDAWQALQSYRGLRVEGRMNVIDPSVLRERADAMDPDDVLKKYSVVSDVSGLIDVYKPLVNDLGADKITIQIASLDATKTLEILGAEVLPKLKET